MEAGLTPVELKRVRHGIFSTEIPVDLAGIPAELIALIERCPEARTYQFVVKSIKRPPRENLGALREKFSIPFDPGNDQGDLRKLLRELNQCNIELRKEREYIAQCLASIKEKDRILKEITSERAPLREENKRYRKELHLLRDALNEGRAPKGEINKDFKEKKSIAGRGSLFREEQLQIHKALSDLFLKVAVSKGPLAPPPPCEVPYDILIPVYNAYEHVARCVESVLRQTTRITYHSISSMTQARIVGFSSLGIF